MLDDDTITQFAQSSHVLEQIRDTLRKAEEWGGLGDPERVYWDPASATPQLGPTAEYAYSGTFVSIGILNMSAVPIRVSFTPNGSTRDRASLFVLGPFAYVVMPYRGSTVSVSGDTAGSALILPFDVPQPFSAGTVSDEGGGIYNAVPPTYTDGGRVEDQYDSRGNKRIVLANANDARLANVLAVGDASGTGNNGLLTVSYNMVDTGAAMDIMRSAKVFKPFASTAIVAGTGATVWTPAAGKKFRLMGWLVSSSAAGQLIFGDNLVATVIARSEAVAAAGVSKAGAGDLGNGILSASANNVLKLDGPTGNVAGMVWGTEE